MNEMNEMNATEVTGMKEEKISMKQKLIAGVLKSKKGSSQLIIELSLVAIGIALCMVFKDQITTLVTGFVTNVTTKLNTGLGI